MKNLIFLVSFLAFFGNGFGQHTRFVVKNENGAPLGNVKVYRNHKPIGHTAKEGWFLAIVVKNDSLTFIGDPELKPYTYVAPEHHPESVEIVLGAAGSFEADPSEELVLPPPPPDPVFLPTEDKPLGENEIHTVADEPAQFPGGPAALNSYLTKNMIYPPRALEEGLEGKVYLKFIVETDGTIREQVVVRKLEGCPECDIEALRLVRKMPKWIPGKVQGETVRTYFNLPITFKLP